MMLWRLIQILTLVGMVVFLNVRVENTENMHGTKTRTSIGLRMSPWYTYGEDRQYPKPLVKYQEVIFLSWSWLCLLPAVMCVCWRQRLMPPTETTK